MGNIHFTEILDFFLGWFTYDIGGDDWATRLAKEDKAALAPPEDPSKELSKDPPGDPPKEPQKDPPKAPPKKASEDPPPRKPEKPPPPSGKKFRIEDLVP